MDDGTSARDGRGSPPQVRGKLIITAPDELGNGITPAGAGKTFFVLLLYGCTKDHPRRCGENTAAP